MISFAPQFFQVNPRGSHVQPLPSDTLAQPATQLSIADLGITAGDIIQLQQIGDFNPGSSDSPFDDQTGLVAVFVGETGPVAALGNFDPYERGLVDDEILFNDIAEDFRVQSSGTTIIVPESASFIAFATTDAFKGPNSDPDEDFGVLISFATSSTGVFTNGDDFFDGGVGNDDVDALGGNDILRGNDGNDTLDGGDGNDTLIGGNGRDFLFGGDGDDLLDASQGAADTQGPGDLVRPGFGSDTILGHRSHYNEGQEGAVLSYADVSGVGGVEVTVTDGASGSGTVASRTGTAINDTFEYSRFTQGSADADIIRGGVDSQHGFAGLRGDDTLVGGSSRFDFLQYNDDRFELGGGGAVTVNFQTGQAIDGFGDTDTFSGMEQVRGTEEGDTFIGSATDERMLGQGGDDTISGRGGNDTLDGGDGNDVLLGGLGSDTLFGGDGDDSLDPGSGSFDWIYTGAGSDTVDYRGAGIGDYAISFYNDVANPIAANFVVASGTGTVVNGGDTDTYLGIDNAVVGGFGLAATQGDDVINVTQIDGGFSYLQGQGGADT